MKKQKSNPGLKPSKGSKNGKWYSGIASGVNGLNKAVKNQVTAMLTVGIILFAVIAGGDDKKPKKEPVKAKKLSKRQEAIIKAETKRNQKILADLPPAPFTTIILAAGLFKLSPAALCNYVTDRLVRITAISEFASCNPSVTFLQTILDALIPYANMGRNISKADRTKMEQLTKQLRENFTNTLLSCIVLSGGNLPLFALLNVKTKSKGKRNTKRLAAPVMKLNTKKGGNCVGVSCKPIKYATSYSIAYGAGDDVTKYKIKTGSSNQLVTDLVGGDLLNFIMWANTGKLAGFPCAPQAIRVPYN